MSSAFGKNILFSVFGQSHSKVIGCLIDTMPAGIKIDTAELEAFMSRRAPGATPYSTARKEADKPVFLCGVLPDSDSPELLLTCGAPLAAVIVNNDARSSDYLALADTPRPAHADYTANIAYGGYQDIRGGGHFSGRLTAPLCIAGGICKQALAASGIHIGAHISSVGSINDTRFSPTGLSAAELESAGKKAFPVLDDSRGEQMARLISDCKADRDSVGGTVECAVTGLPAGLGSPMFEGVENRLSAALFGIPALKGLEFGSGFSGCADRASVNNDCFTATEEGITTKTNNHGGILGGITSGLPLIFRAAFKATPSISREQHTVSYSQNRDTVLSIPGRHDPCVVPRAVAVVEALTACVIYDLTLDFTKHIR